jgi:hypothetical protein
MDFSLGNSFLPNICKFYTKGNFYTEAVLKFPKLNTQAQQRGAVAQGRSLSPYRLRYLCAFAGYKLNLSTKPIAHTVCGINTKHKQPFLKTPTSYAR